MTQLQQSAEELLQLATALRQAVRVKDRRYLFRAYRRCFVGQEAVAWLVSSGAAGCAAEAVLLGNQMMEMGLFHHVMYEHVFEDDYLFYRFTDDDSTVFVAAGDGSTAPGADQQPGGRHSGNQIRRILSSDGLKSALAGGLTSPRQVDAGPQQPRVQAQSAIVLPTVRSHQPLATTSDDPGAAATAAASSASSAAASAAAAAASTAAAAAAYGTTAAAAGAAEGSGGAARAGGRLLLSEPRQDRSRQVLTGYLQQLQGRVEHMLQAAEAQRAIADILVSEVSSLHGEVSELRGRLHEAAAQLLAANAGAAMAAQHTAGLRLLGMGLCACVLQQALIAWMGALGASASVSAGGGGGVAGVLFSGGGTCWGVALAVAVALLGLVVLLPAKQQVPVAAPVAAVTAADGSLMAARQALAKAAALGLPAGEYGGGVSGGGGVGGGGGAPSHQDQQGSEAGGGPPGGGGGDGLQSDHATASTSVVHGTPRGSCEDRRSGGGRGGAGAPEAPGTLAPAAQAAGSYSGSVAGSGGGGGSTVTRRYKEMVRLLTAPVRLHFPGKRRERDSPPPPHQPHQHQQHQQLTSAPLRSPSERQPLPLLRAPSAHGGPAAAARDATLGAAATAAPLAATPAAAAVTTTTTTTTATTATTAAALGGVDAAGRVASSTRAPASQGVPAKEVLVLQPVAARPPGEAASRAAAVPRLADFKGWRDAPVLLAFNTALVPEHAAVEEAAEAEAADGGAGWRGERGRSRAGSKLAPDQAGNDGGGVHLQVNAGGPQLSDPPRPSSETTASASTPVGGDAGSSIHDDVYGSDGGGSGGGGRDGDPSPPLTPASPASSVTGGGGGRPFAAAAAPALTAGLLRLPANGVRPIRVETELFSGELMIYMRGLSTSSEAMFVGKKRMSWVAMQGRFKVPLSLNSVSTGQEFARPFKRLPAAWFVEKVLLSMARQVSPSMRVGPLSAPCLLLPIIAAAQLVNVSKPGYHPPVLDCREDVRLFCPRLAVGASAAGGRSGGHGGGGGGGGGDLPASADARRRHFSSARNRAGLMYDTEHVWTFHFWQQFVDLAAYKLDFGYTYDLVRHLDGQPLQVMAKDVDSGKYLYNVLIWHERLLHSAAAAAGTEAASLGFGGSGGGGVPASAAADEYGEHGGEQDGCDGIAMNDRYWP